jgi:rSAM/selenodomain-associated transferase 1
MTVTPSADSCVLFFVKYPEKEKVKQRLAMGLTVEIAVELYKNFVLDSLSMLKGLAIPFYICIYPGSAKKRFNTWLGNQHQYLSQEGEGFGDRMVHCFQQAFAKGYNHVVLIGSDSPDLPGDYIRRAFALLKGYEAVLGPAADGGYYLIGFRQSRFTAEAFKGIHWSTSTVFEETMTKLQAAHRTVGLLPSWNDVDTITDLQKLIARAKDTSFKSSHTMTYVHQHDIGLEEDHGAKPG